MTFEKTYEIHDNGQIIIKLPDMFRKKKKVRVIIEDIEEDNKSKLDLLRKASKDPLFLSDIEDVKDDFLYSDKEAL